MFLLNFSKSLNNPARACQKLCLLVTILTPHDGITRFDGIMVAHSAMRLSTGWWQTEHYIGTA